MDTDARRLHTTDADTATDGGTIPEVALDIRRWARCSDGRGSFNHIFFSDEPLEIARAKAICSRCVLRVSCLAGAVARGEVWGVWGGEILVDGQVVAEKRRRGRPPKHPRPLVVVDEVPGEQRDHVA